MRVPSATTLLFWRRQLFILSTLACLWPVVVAPQAQAQSFLLEVDTDFAAVVDLLREDQPAAAEQELDQVSAAQRNGDYHYLRGVIAMTSMNDAGAFRMARLARRLRGHFEDAIAADPDHALAHFGLLQYHRFAPGIMGGRQRELEYHQQRLIELDSFLQFPAALVKAQVEEDQAAQQSIYEAWITHSPHIFEAHYGYLSSLIGWAEYDSAQQAITTALAHADSDQVQLIHYQEVRLAALYGVSQHEQTPAERAPADTVPLTTLPWFEQAYATGLALLADANLNTQIDSDWLQLRMAQIEWAQQDHERALARVNALRQGDIDERLRAEVETLANKLSQS